MPATHAIDEIIHETVSIRKNTNLLRNLTASVIENDSRAVFIEFSMDGEFDVRAESVNVKGERAHFATEFRDLSSVKDAYMFHRKIGALQAPYHMQAGEFIIRITQSLVSLALPALPVIESVPDPDSDRFDLFVWAPIVNKDGSGYFRDFTYLFFDSRISDSRLAIAPTNDNDVFVPLTRSAKPKNQLDMKRIERQARFMGDFIKEGE